MCHLVTCSRASLLRCNQRSRYQLTGKGYKVIITFIIKEGELENEDVLGMWVSSVIGFLLELYL